MFGIADDWVFVIAIITSTSPRVAGWLNKLAGTMLAGFGLKLAISK